MSSLQLIIGAMPGLADVVASAGIADVHRVDGTAGFRQLAPNVTGPQSQIVSLFADDTPGDDMPLSDLVALLAGKGWKVIVVSVAGQARQIAEHAPGCEVLEGPLSLNRVLATLSGLGVGHLPALPDGHAPLDARTGVIPAAPAQPQSPLLTAPNATAAGPVGPQPTFAAPPAPAAPAGAASPGPVFGAPGVAVPSRAEEVPGPAARATEHPTFAPAAPAPRTPTFAPAAGGTAARPAPVRRGLGTVTGPASSPEPSAAPPAPQQPTPVRRGLGAAAGTPVAPGTSVATVPTPGGPLAPATAPAPVSRGGYRTTSAGEPDTQGWVVAVIGPKGGVGKTNLSLNLATYAGLRLKAEGKRVCLVDANLQQADIGKYIRRYTPTVSDYITHPEAITPDRIHEFLVHKPELNLSILLAPSLSENAHPLDVSPDLYNQILLCLRQRFDYIIIDTPAAELYNTLFMHFVLPNADFLLVPVTPNHATLLNTEQYLRNICEPTLNGGAGFEPKDIGVVLNRAESGIGCDVANVRDELHEWGLVSVIPESKEWKLANNEYEIIATKNYAELNSAFAKTCFAMTGEPVFADDNAPNLAAQSRGLLEGLRSRLRR